MKTIIDTLGSMAPSITAKLRGQLGALAASALLLGSAGTCLAANNMVVTAQNFWTNAVLYTEGVNSVDSSHCDKQTVGAAPEIIVDGVTYEFLFWDINAAPHTEHKVKFQPICGSANTAVALYWPICTNAASCSGTATTDSTVAYSLNDHKIIAGKTPIASVSGGAWTPGSTVVTPPATITALSEILGYGRFKGWEVPPSPISTSSELTLDGAGAVAIAFYGIPEPDPCQTLRNEAENAGEDCVGDGLSPKQCEALIKMYALQLQQCEATYGE